MSRVRSALAWPVLLIGLLALILLQGCSSTPPGPDPAQPEIERATLARSAALSFAQGQYGQAATLYGKALEQAMIEDRPAAIIDHRFNIALARMYLGEHDAALRQLALADAERRRRGLGTDAGLDLLAATVHYRAGAVDAAGTALDRVFAQPAADPSTRVAAHFLAGLMAAGRGDSAALAVQRAALPLDESPAAVADRAELDAHAALLRGDPAAALGLFDSAVAARRAAADFHGMARALAAAGDAAADGGEPRRAAGYYLRAGRSAALRGGADAARWLQQAIALGLEVGDAPLVDDARDALARQAAPSGPSAAAAPAQE
jgi:tetratricopeptide (TPR) repeat protein